MEQYQACMLLAAVGDALGYKNGQWEFNRSGLDIHTQMMQLTHQKGILKLRLDKKNFRYSDDTVMHFATAKGLVQCRIED